MKNSTNNVHQFNGKIITHTLHLNWVSGNELSTKLPASLPLDSIIGDSGNFRGKIQVKPISGADWGGFVPSLYREERNTPVKGERI